MRSYIRDTSNTRNKSQESILEPNPSLAHASHELLFIFVCKNLMFIYLTRDNLKDRLLQYISPSRGVAPHTTRCRDENGMRKTETVTVREFSQPFPTVFIPSTVGSCLLEHNPPPQLMVFQAAGTSTEAQSGLVEEDKQRWASGRVQIDGPISFWPSATCQRVVLHSIFLVVQI